MDHLGAAAAAFAAPGAVVELREYGQGNVNDTFLVSVADPEGERFILQRLNPRVFQRPELIMANLATVTGHVQRHRLASPESPPRRWELPHARLTRDGRDHVIDAGGSFWRALSFIADAQAFDTIQDIAHAVEVGYALGRFHTLLSDLPPAQLADTLPGFHQTTGYLKQYDRVLAAKGVAAAPEAAYAARFVADRRDRAPVLENARHRGQLRQRPIHGDPKVNNVMLDAATGRAVAMIDLDTVKPGLVHYDIGDCLRSGCNPLGEETAHREQVRFEPELGRAILQGYLGVAREFLTGSDYAYLYDAIRLIAFELGLRFFTDYLAGNVYFRVKYREHNLARALVQFKLTASIEAQASVIQAMIRELACTATP